MITNLLYLLLLLAGFPAGILLSKLCREEIKSWRKRLLILSATGLLLAVILSFIPFMIFPYKFPVTISLFFIMITNMTIIWKSLNEKKTKKQKNSKKKR